MSMLNLSNQAAVEALCSGTYLEHYLETIESLPDDLQRNVTLLRELDIQSRELLQEIEQNCEALLDGSCIEGSSSWRKNHILTQRALARCQDSGDEKLQLLSNISEHIENRSRLLDQYRENLEPGSKKEPEKEEPPPRKEPKNVEPVEKVEKPGTKRQRRAKATEVVQEEAKEEKEKTTGNKKKKKRKIMKKEGSPVDVPIDPNEPTYCLCNNISYGEMIGCDNLNCEIEWYHFPCVQLTTKPKGKWYCPNCRGDKPNVKKPDK
ncbi:inhibitor of growth protein 1-like [Babylonia areolata]|uniref:inhibitor of growth protein 1-like n=1 Tax=Babylonia areolata TaxID=304850 RepID=UPI003FD6AE08